MDEEQDLRLTQVKTTHNYKTLTYHLKKKKKQAEYRKQLVKDLIETGVYSLLYHHYILSKDDNDINNKMSYNDLKILELFDFQPTEEVIKIYNELFNI